VGFLALFYKKFPETLDFFFPRWFFFVPDSQRKKALKKGEPSSKRLSL
jgi:hypothetical protein